MNENKFFAKFLENLNKFDSYHVKNIVELIEEQRKTFRMILDHLDEALIVIEEDEIIFINSKAESILGTKNFKIPQKLDLARVHVRNLPLFDFILASLHDVDYVTEFNYETQSTIYFEIEKKTKDNIFMIKIRDITSQKKLEFQLRSFETITALNTLAAGIAHEIKNPMAAIDLHTQVIKKAIDKGLVCAPDEVVNYVQIIDEETSRLNNILNDFLLSARKRELQLSFEDINQFLENTFDFFQPEFENNHINLVTDFDEHLPKIFIDKNYLKQAIINLIKNAIEAVYDSANRIIKISTLYDIGRNAIDISISDTGKGLDEENIKKIFEPYYSSKDNGTGLGLTIVFKIVEEHGGEIIVDRASPPFSTSFTISLPTTKGTKKLPTD